MRPERTETCRMLARHRKEGQERQQEREAAKMQAMQAIDPHVVLDLHPFAGRAA